MSDIVKQLDEFLAKADDSEADTPPYSEKYLTKCERARLTCVQLINQLAIWKLRTNGEYGFSLVDNNLFRVSCTNPSTIKVHHFTNKMVNRAGSRDKKYHQYKALISIMTAALKWCNQPKNNIEYFVPAKFFADPLLEDVKRIDVSKNHVHIQGKSWFGLPDIFIIWRNELNESRRQDGSCHQPPHVRQSYQF